MQQHVSVKEALRAFQVIRDQGTKVDEGYALNGITAATDFDGYNVTLSNDQVTLSIHFHNTFDIEYTNKKELSLFIEKIQAINKARQSIVGTPSG